MKRTVVYYKLSPELERKINEIMELIPDSNRKRKLLYKYLWDKANWMHPSGEAGYIGLSICQIFDLEIEDNYETFKQEHEMINVDSPLQVNWQGSLRNVDDVKCIFYARII